MSDSASDQGLLHASLGEFLATVSAPEATPAGGSVVAVTVAMAAGLCLLAARLSARQMPDATDLAVVAEQLRDRAAALCQCDADAYGQVIAAMRCPRDPDPEDRRRAIARALSESTDVLVEMAEIAAHVADLARRLTEGGNPKLHGDAVTAALLAESAVRSVAAMVDVNLATVSVDDRPSRVAALLNAASASVALAQRPTEG